MNTIRLYSHLRPTTLAAIIYDLTEFDSMTQELDEATTALLTLVGKEEAHNLIWEQHEKEMSK